MAWPHQFALAVVLFLGAAASVHAASPLAGPDTSSPRATYQSFERLSNDLEQSYLTYRADKSLEKAQVVDRIMRQQRRLFDLSELPPATQHKISGAAIVYLIDVLNRLPNIPIEKIPGGDIEAEALPDRWTFPETEIRVERIQEGPNAGDYLFSADTVRQLPDFHKLIINQPPVRESVYGNWRLEQIRWTGPAFPYHLVEDLPAFWQQPTLGTLLWKVVLTAAMLIVLLLAVFLWKRSVYRWGQGRARVWQLLWRSTAPMLMISLILGAELFLVLQVNLAGLFAESTAFILSIAMNIGLAWLVWCASFALVELVIASPAIPDDSYDAHLLRLLARVGALIGVAAVIVYGANDLGIPAIGLVASLGVGGFALALAAQSTVENLFGGVSIFADRPFRVGHFIHCGGESGIVESIGPRSTRIRCLDSTLLTVPNSDLAKMHITNFSLRDKCLFLHTIGLRYETSTGQFEWLLHELRKRFEAHPMVEQAPGFPRIRMIGFGASSIDVEVRAHVLTVNFSEFLEIQEELIMEVMRIVEEAGTGFAFPSQTTYLGRDTGLDQDTKHRVERQMRLRKCGPEPEPDQHPDDVTAAGPDASGDR